MLVGLLLADTRPGQSKAGSVKITFRLLLSSTMAAVLIPYVMAAAGVRLPEEPSRLPPAAGVAASSVDSSSAQNYVLEHGAYNKEAWITQWNALAVVVGL